ncbi:MAG: hypothetical protein IPJ49_25250 [Candidatus Obscuribacter sp.]|nr:hypothetical protein [Candidatus Obscuribacter sp.]
MTQPSVAPPIVTKESPYSVKETADRLEQILHDKNIQLLLASTTDRLPETTDWS